MEESGLAVTAMAVHHSSSGPWHWAPNVTSGIACTINIYAVVNYRKFPQFNGGGSAILSGVGTGALHRQRFENIPCTYKNAFELADNKFGKDSKSVSVAVACTVSLDKEVGQFVFRAALNRGLVCRTMEEVNTKLQLRLEPSSTLKPEEQGPAQVLSFTARARMQRAVVTHHASPHPSKFAVVTVASFESSYTPYMLYMFVQHHLALGLIVIVYDRGGSHEHYLESLFSLADFYYFPFTVMERLEPVTYGHHGGSNSSLALYYGTERSKKAKDETHNMKVNDISNTLAMDRDKQATVDHARVEFAAIPGMLFIDADEFMYCPNIISGTSFDNVSTLAALKERVNRELWNIKSWGVDEIRVDTHPHTGPAGSTVESIHQCLMAGYHVAMQGKGSLAHDVNVARMDSTTTSGIRAMHACFSNISTIQTWSKSMDFGQRCPFHYNHWSCDGGKGAGRQTFCRCRCSVHTWARGGHNRLPETCSLVHYNPHLFNQHDKTRGPHGAKLLYEGPSPIATLIRV